MKRFCLPGLPYSQCIIWPSLLAKITPAQYPDKQKSLLAQSTQIKKKGLVPTL